MSELKANEYRCAHCRGVFAFGWSEEEAKAEQKANGFDTVPCDLVCDDCYKRFMRPVETEHA